MAFTFESTVVVSLDGIRHLSLKEFEGVHRIANRDAVGFYFRVRSPRDSEDSRIAVLFSGTSLMAAPKYFGLPDLGDRDANFTQFALAAVGDHLDDSGPPPFTPSGVPAAQIEAFSGRFQEWKERDAADDDAVLLYMKARLFWSWKYDVPTVSFTSHDVLRLGIDVADLHRLAMLEEGRLWSTHVKTPHGIALESTPALLRAARDLFETPKAPVVAAPILPTNAKTTASEPTKEPTLVNARPAKKRASRKKKRTQDGIDATALVFVDEARLADLRQVSSEDYDLRRVIALCEELNVCYRSQCYFGVAALTRALMDHVPPAFGADSFAEVASNYSGGRSFKASMQHLQLSLRNIADAHLHTQIRKKESLPTRTQVNFAADVDVLLAELVRILS